MLLNSVWCILAHPYDHTPLLWNGAQGKWMHWCHECSEWRSCSRKALENKMRDMMENCRGC